MKLNRFYVGEGYREEKYEYKISGDKLVLYSQGLLHQLRNVFRFTQGDECILFDNSQNEYLVKLDHLKKDRGEFDIIIKTLIDEDESSVSLYMSVIKKDLFELVTQKVTEIGISKITPIQTERTIVKNLREDRLEKIVVEATEQSGGTRVPEIGSILKLEEALRLVSERGEKIIVTDVAERDSLEKIKKEENKVALFAKAY
jgi:16S rRNA (uracil1498-N3)-methyltransferase